MAVDVSGLDCRWRIGILDCTLSWLGMKSDCTGWGEQTALNVRRSILLVLIPVRVLSSLRYPNSCPTLLRLLTKLILSFDLQIVTSGICIGMHRTTDHNIWSILQNLGELFKTWWSHSNIEILQLYILWKFCGWDELLWRFEVLMEHASRLVNDWHE